MFLLFIKTWTWLQSWTGDIFPLVHGRYYIGDSGDIQDYEFCNIAFAYVQDFSLFSNDDLYFLYNINVN